MKWLGFTESVAYTSGVQTLFYNPNDFDFVKPLEQNWRGIYADYLKIKSNLVDWYEKDLYEKEWKVFGLFNFPQGEAIEKNVRRCKFTASWIQEHIKHHGAVGFSVLKPMTQIKPHQGYQGDFLRCHLGLKIPKGKCSLKVNNELRQWEDGKVLIFDDRDWHEACNLTNEERVILLIDFIP
jgi:beta-hydroxylase